VASPAIYRSNRRGARPPMHSITTPTADSSRTKSTTGAAISLGVEPPPGHTSGALGLRGCRRLALEAVRRFPRMRSGAGPVGAGVTLSRSRPTAFPPRRRALPARRGRDIRPPPGPRLSFRSPMVTPRERPGPTTGNYGYPPTSIARRRSPSASRSFRRHYPKQVPAASEPSNALSARCPSSRVCERTLSDLDAGPI
jgi:hypothetical protein